MSGNWEVVGKNKQKQNNQGSKKLTKNERKNFVENAPKLEDILPLAQFKSLYTALDSNKENQTPKGKENSSKENDAKKTQRKQPEKKKEVKEKAPVPKSLENAAALIDLKELTSVLEVNQARFPEAPLVWLKILAEYLNIKLEHSNPVVSHKSPEYPLCVLPSSVRDALQRVVRQVGESTAQHFYELCLTSLANDMVKGTTTIYGYKVFLQVLAFQNPGITVANIPKLTLLRNSYQNRQNIGLALLWGFGLGGMKDFPVGVKAWEELMLPVLDLKNYTSYVITYVKDLFQYKSKNKNMTPEQFFKLLDFFSTPNPSLPHSRQRDLQKISSVLMAQFFKSDSKKQLRDFFAPMLQRLGVAANAELREELLVSLITCLISKDRTSFVTWTQVYSTNLLSSAILLKHIELNWQQLKQQLPLAIVKETLISFQRINEDLMKNRQKDVNVEKCCSSVEVLLKKMTVTKSFPWRYVNFLLVLAISGLLAFDINKHGTFKASSTGRFLSDIGALKHGETFWEKTQLYSAETYRWAQTNIPVYYKAASEYTRPYLSKGWEAGVVVGSQLRIWYSNVQAYVDEKSPVVIEWVNYYAPGITDRVRSGSADAWVVVKHYSWSLSQNAVELSSSAVDWTKTNVFVGSWSPENIQKYSNEALNTTQAYATWTYDWLCQKVQTLSKVQ